jgi:hypothetical protein
MRYYGIAEESTRDDVQWALLNDWPVLAESAEDAEVRAVQALEPDWELWTVDCTWEQGPVVEEMPEDVHMRLVGAPMLPGLG